MFIEIIKKLLKEDYQVSRREFLKLLFLLMTGGALAGPVINLIDLSLQNRLDPDNLSDELRHLEQPLSELKKKYGLCIDTSQGIWERLGTSKSFHIDSPPNVSQLSNWVYAVHRAAQKYPYNYFRTNEVGSVGVFPFSKVTTFGFFADGTNQIGLNARKSTIPGYDNRRHDSARVLEQKKLEAAVHHELFHACHHKVHYGGDYSEISNMTEHLQKDNVPARIFVNPYDRKAYKKGEGPIEGPAIIAQEMMTDFPGFSRKISTLSRNGKDPKVQEYWGWRLDYTQRLLNEFSGGEMNIEYIQALLSGNVTSAYFQ